MTDACRVVGVTPPDTFPDAGKWHHADIEGDPHGKGDARIKLFLDGEGGIVHNWKSDEQQVFFANGVEKLTPDQRAIRQQAIAAVRIRADEDMKLERRNAAEKAQAIWKAAAPATEHPYLTAKGIKPHGAKLHGDALVIPMRADGEIQSLQFIGTDKRFLTGGRVAGCYFSIGNPKGAKSLAICEGFATGVSIHEATGHPVAVAFNAGNLLLVGKTMREKFPDLQIVVCADDDWKSLNNPGLTKATEAAQAVGAYLAVPTFSGDRRDKDTDFNDMAATHGLGAVKRAIAGAAAQASPDTQAEPVKPMAMEPEPLRATLPPAEAYPVEALGDILGGAALALHESVKAPLALCCQSVLAAASLAAQAHYDIVLPWGERKPLSLFLLTVGQSGERKSGIDDLVLGAAKAQERKAMDEYALDMERYESDKASWDQAVDAARKSVTNGRKGTANPSEIRQAIEQAGDKPIAPVAPLRFVTDPTVEGLFKLLVVGQPSVALFSDEGGLLIGGHALNSDNALKTMARWCKLWDGSPFDRVRGGDGAGVLYGRRMALHQLAQPEVMIKLLSDPMANGQGFLARCLVAWPSSTIGTRHVEQFEWAGDRREVKRLYAVLSGLMEAEAPTGATAQELDPVKLPLSDEAKALAVAASNQFESLMAAGADLAELQDRTSKAMDNACRIAGVLTVIEQGLAARVIDAEPLQRGLILVQWYLAEALRIRGAAAVPQSVSDAEMLSAWLRERGLRMFRSAQPLQTGPNQLRHKPRLNAAIAELVASGYLAENDPGELVDGVMARKSWRVLHHVV
jgi:putative DNA primase/helicase